MRHKLGILLAGSALMAGPATAQNATSLLQAADKAIGASAVNSVVYTGTGWMGAVGQSFATEGTGSDWPRTDFKSYTATIDYASKSFKEDHVRVQGNNPPRGGGFVPLQGEVHTTNFASGNYAWNLNPQGQPNPQQAAAEYRQLLISLTPHGFIKAAQQAGNATVEDRYYIRQDRTLKVVGFTTMGKYRVTGEFNKDNLLERVITSVPDPVLGDMMVEIRYSDYRDVGNGAKFPFRSHAHQGDNPLVPGGHNWMEVRVTDAKVNVPDAALTVPDNARNAPAPQQRVAAQKLGDGVWLMGGSNANSVAVEFKDFIAVIEAPTNEVRSNAVIAEIKKTIPNKPIRYVVVTHHHFDHLGGVRTYAAEGATVIADDHDRDYFQKVVLGPQSRTLEPDRLSQFPFAPTGPGPVTLQTFTDEYSISDGQHSIKLYHVDNLNHADDMLVAYLPQDKILINADLYGPPPAGGTLANVNLNAVALFRNIKRLKLDVAQHVPIHGNPGSNADFERIVGPVAARTPAPGGGG
ncbi:MAG TPA: MBL fold metallo-hydrolase [Xanthobacteraceae bacterium]|nr:MBL fold metallo-hydrolase [Xanthobacteraceae bacterium]